MIAHETTGSRGEEIIEYHQITHMPADPALKAVYLDNEGKVYFGPVLCWQIQTVYVPESSSHTFVSPVTPAGEENTTPVLYPDGVVRDQDEFYESVEAWAEEEREWRERKRRLEEQREKKAAYGDKPR